MKRSGLQLKLFYTTAAVLLILAVGWLAGLFLYGQQTPGLSVAEESFAADASPGAGGRLILQVAEQEAKEAAKVHLGGHMAGFSLTLNGVMILDFCEVETAAGKAYLKSELKAGDIIEEIEGRPVRSSKEIKGALNEGKKRERFRLKVSRDGEKKEFSVSPLIEKVTNEYRLGVLVKNDIAGIGTVTFTRQDGRFAALGHAISGGGSVCEIAGGTAYECRLLGLEKGAKGRAGSVKGSINGQKPLGKIDKNIVFGIYGNFDAPKGALYEVAKREEIRPGKAQICSSIGGSPEFYDIEIVKTVYQANEGEKGMIIRVLDKRLLDLTGGIIQGMSGSPILQKNKVVGAVTHVFIKDPTRGYGIYADWMLNQ